MNTVELSATSPELTAQSTSTWRDWLGIVASVGCAIHCAAMPFVIAYLPALGLSFLADEAFHKWMALVCFLIAIASFIPGVRTHGNWTPISVGAIGLAIITFAAFGLAGECCPSCAANSQAAVGVDSGCDDPNCENCDSTSTNVQTVAAVNSSDDDACCENCESCDASKQTAVAVDAGSNDACCENCESCGSSEVANSDESSSNLEPTDEKSLLTMLAPWLTPFGGLLLVSAHLLNRRFGCLCGCCGTESKPATK